MLVLGKATTWWPIPQVHVVTPHLPYFYYSITMAARVEGVPWNAQFAKGTHPHADTWAFPCVTRPATEHPPHPTPELRRAADPGT